MNSDISLRKSPLDRLLRQGTFDYVRTKNLNICLSVKLPFALILDILPNSISFDPNGPFLALDLAKFLNPDFFHFEHMATLLVPSFGTFGPWTYPNFLIRIGTFGLGKCPDPDIWANLGQCPDLDILPNSFSFDPTGLGLCSSTQDIVHIIISKVFFQLKFIAKSHSWPWT